MLQLGLSSVVGKLQWADGLFLTKFQVKRTWVWKRPDPSASPRGEPVTNGIRVYNKLGLENKRVAEQIGTDRHSTSITGTDETDDDGI